MNRLIRCGQKCTILFLLIVSFGSVFAYPLSGVFVSAGSGAAFINSKLNSLASYDISQAQTKIYSSSIESDASRSSINPFASLGLGYGHLIGNFYLGLEGNYSLFGGQFSSYASQKKLASGSSLTLNNKLIFSDQLGASALLGYKWQRWMSFIRLGYVNATLALDSSVIYYPSTGNSMTLSSNKSTRLNGGLVGLGLRLPVSDHVSVSAEYDYSLYENKTLRMSADGQDASKNVYHVDTVVKIHNLNSSTGLVSLIYTF